MLTVATHGHHDALFSMWRLSWIAHALATPGTSLFDAPIFVPVGGTLAFSDAVLLQGVLAWPWLALGVPALTVYNVLLLGGMWASACATFVLARHLTGSSAAGLVAGVIFGFAPYRIEHAMHLELQWSQWMPLTLWAVHRAWRHARLRDGALAGVFLTLQFLSCIYYGVFLALFLVVVAPALVWWRRPARPARTAAALLLGALIALPPVVAYGLPYRANQATLGGRSSAEIANWSARPTSYLAVPPENRLYGSTLEAFGTPEGRLFPGLVAIGLALVAMAGRSRLAVAYAWGLAWAVILSLGVHTPAYGVMLRTIPPLDGLRAPARFAMIALLALAILAAIGVARLMAGGPEDEDRPQTAGLRPQAAAARQVWLALALMAMATAEYASAFGPLHPWPREAPLYAAWLETQPRAAAVEFPVPRGHALPLYEAEWSFLGTFHHQPLVNGYSGYFPRPYLDLLGALAHFPSGESVWALQKRGVRYVVLHEDRYAPTDFLALLGEMERYPCLSRVGRFPDATYPVSVYRLCKER